MVKFTQKYAIVQFFEEITEGYTYPANNWPLHSTIVDTFAINWSADEMIAKLTGILKHHTIANSRAGDCRFLGEKEQVKVVLIDQTKSLIKLHKDMLTTLEDGELNLNDPQFAGDNFLPHATVQRHKYLGKGDKVLFTALSIIDMFPNEDPYMRKVLKTIKIGR